ncbi:MAG: Holliday junction resolvase RecU, partial [Acidobacteriota bacterium]
MPTTLKRRGADTGSGFQAAINSTNEAYAHAQRAYITRKSVPGKYLLRRDKQRRGLTVPDLTDLPAHKYRLSGAQLIKMARAATGPPQRDFVPEAKAEPDYGGAVAPLGRAIFYDAKSTQRDRLDLDNLHPHQIYFLECMATAGAISGFLVEFMRYQKVFFLPIQLLQLYCHTTGHKSVPFRFFIDHLVTVPSGKGLLLFDYLSAIEEQELRYGQDYSRFSFPNT